MPVCNLCGETWDADDIEFGLGPNCYAIFGEAVYAGRTDVAKTISAVAKASVSNFLSFWSGTTGTIATGVKCPIFRTTPTRNQTITTVASRTSDTDLAIDTDGKCNVKISFIPSSAADTFELQIEGVTWQRQTGDMINFNLSHDFSADDVITIVRTGISTETVSYVTVNID